MVSLNDITKKIISKPEFGLLPYLWNKRRGTNFIINEF